MKKSMLVLVMGLCGTAVFAQDAKTELSKENDQVKTRSGAKSKTNLRTDETKSAADYKAQMSKNKLEVHKTMSVQEVDMQSSSQPKVKVTTTQ